VARRGVNVSRNSDIMNNHTFCMLIFFLFNVTQGTGSIAARRGVDVSRDSKTAGGTRDS